MRTTKIGSQDKKLYSNSFFGVVASVISIVSTYATRVVFSNQFGDEIYGVHSLFASIVSALLIVEMGISSAMVIFMYKPIAEKDNSRVNTILKLYKKLYSYICLIILFAGVFIDLFVIQFLISTTLEIGRVRIYFLLYLISIVAKYLWSYKRCILFASNQNRISSIISAVVDMFFTGVEICAICFANNYVIYLVVFILHNMGANILCNLFVNKRYPFVKTKDVIAPTKEDEKYVFKIVKPMFVQRIANQIQDSSTSIIYSFLGYAVTYVGYYANYLLVIHAVETVYNQIALAVSSSFGCAYVKDNDVDTLYQNYTKNRYYLGAIIAIMVGCYCCFITPFIRLFFGTDYVLEKTILILTTTYLYLLLNNEINKSIQNALGIHRIDTIYMVIQTVVGIILSIVLGMIMGLQGVLIGMLISFLLFSTINKGRMIYIKLFNRKTRKYYCSLLSEAILSFLLVWGSFQVFSLFDVKSVAFLVLSALILFVGLSIASICSFWVLYRVKSRYDNR